MAEIDESINPCPENVSSAAEIFAEHGDYIYKIIRYKAQNQNDVDDLYHDFFLSLVAKPVPPDIENIKSYLYRAITNDIIDAARRMERHKSLMNKYTENCAFFVNKSGSTDAYLVEANIDKILSLAKEKLSPKKVRALALRYKNNLSNEDIARKLGVKKESVSRYICIGLKEIQSILAKKEEN
jgi:RNA polymerase sigma factor (sigma-70 family)